MKESGKAPATLALGALWVVVFVALCAVQGRVPVGVYPYGGSILASTSHRFGDLSSRELMGGQIWRAVTATFVHYSLLHLVLNLIGLIQLGRMVESWYGSGPMLGIYLAIGGLGNLAAGLVRPWVDGRPDVHCGGGSTVVMGLIALIAVVGWRSHAEFSVNVWSRMSGLLMLNILLGLLLPNIDNYGHVAGALCGAAVGLADAAVLRLADRPGLRWSGLLAIVILACCALAQFGEDRVEKIHAARAQVVQDLIHIRSLYAVRAQMGPVPSQVLRPRGANLLEDPPLVLPADRHLADSIRGAMARALRRLEGAEGVLGSGSTATTYRRWKVLVARTSMKPPTPEECREFDALFGPLLERAVQQLKTARVPFGIRSPGAG